MREGINVKSKEAMKPEVTEFDILQDAVKNLYYSAVWHADRPVDEAVLWTAVRDAAGLTPGRPKEIVFEGIRAAYTVDRLRQIGHLVSAKNGKEFGTSETRAFLLLYGTELQSKIDAAVRQFLEEKLS
jgi:hypothetical protein